MPKWKANSDTLQDQTWDRWMDGKVGDLLYEMAGIEVNIEQKVFDALLLIRQEAYKSSDDERGER